jgi:hypothetical protein
VSANISDKTGVIKSIECNVNLLLEVVCIGEGGKVVRIGYERGRLGPYNRGHF